MSSSSSHDTSPEQAPLSHVLAPEYPEYLAPSDAEVPAEDQPLASDASPATDLPEYIATLESIEDDSEEDPEMDPIDYATDEEEEEHLAQADSALPIPNYVPLVKETKPFETDESAGTPPPPRSPHTIIPLSHTRLRRAQISVRPHTPPSPSTETRIAEYAYAPTPPSPFSPLSSLLLLIPSPPLLLPSPTDIDIILEADMLLRKRVGFTASSYRFEIGESLAAVAARLPGISLS
uniref:Uncharacterized protein n=1 Tax=Tanacetum cinerariifolium TaxID=118510 RepID=A0A699J1F0_TANCI|nr:hypothetical protein [Tanacetum cinerariifolium]